MHVQIAVHESGKVRLVQLTDSEAVAAVLGLLMRLKRSGRDADGTSCSEPAIEDMQRLPQPGALRPHM